MWARGAKFDFHPDITDDSRNITAYEMVAEPGHHVSRITGSNLYTGYVTGLTAGTTYTVKVTAQSAAGPGPAATFTVTPTLTSNIVGIGDLTRDRHNDVVAILRDVNFAKGYWGNGKGGFTGGAHNIMNTFPGSRVIPAGDLTGDGVPDLLSDHVGRLELYQGTNAGFLTEPTVASRGWTGMRFITGGGDFSGDGRADVLGVTPTGQLNLYPGNGRGTLVLRTQDRLRLPGHGGSVRHSRLQRRPHPRRARRRPSRRAVVVPGQRQGWPSRQVEGQRRLGGTCDDRTAGRLHR